jgi:hypothetical protein
LFAFSAVVAAGAFELVSLAQSVNPFVADLLRASMTGVGTAALVRAMAFLVGATAGPTAAATAQNTTTNSIVPTAAMGTSTSMQLVATKGQQALVLQQGQAISSTRSQEVPTVIPEICWEVEKGCEMEYYLPLMTPECRQWWYGFWWDKSQTNYIDCCLRAISSSTVNNSIGSRSSYSRVKLISSGSSSSRRALPPVGGSWATRGALALPGTHLTTLLASSQLLHQAGHLAALPSGAKRAWLPRASSICCPGARLPAAPLRQAAPTTLPVSCAPAGPSQPTITTTSSSATPLSKLAASTNVSSSFKSLALAAAPKPYALLAAPKPPAALIPPTAASLAGALFPPAAQLLAACAASVEDIAGRGTFPSHALSLVDSITSHPLALVADGELEELEALNNIVELPEGGLEEAGGSGGVPALVTPGGGVAVATRTLTTTFGSAQVRPLPPHTCTSTAVQVLATM